MTIIKCTVRIVYADVSGHGGMADALDLGSSVNRRVGSSPIARTKTKSRISRLKVKSLILFYPGFANMSKMYEKNV